MTTSSTVCTPSTTTPTVEHDLVQHTDPVALGYDAWATAVAPLVPWFQSATPAEQRLLYADHCLYSPDDSPTQWATLAGGYATSGEYVGDAADGQGMEPQDYTDRLSVWLAEDAAAREPVPSATEKTAVSDVAQEPVAQEPVYDCTEADEATALKDWTRYGKNASTAALDQGLSGLRYNRCRQALHAKVSRDVCITTLVNSWQEHCDTTVTAAKVDKSLLHAAVWELLGGKAKVGSVAGRVLRAWAPLVSRDTTSRQERYTLPTGHETLCQEQWAAAVKAKLTGEEHGGVVRAIQVTIATARRAAAEERWVKQPCNATAQDMVTARKAELEAVAATAEKDKPAPVAPALAPAALAECRKRGVEPAEVKPGTAAPAAEIPATGKAPGTAAPAAPETKKPGTPAPAPGTVAPNTDTAQGISPLAALAESAKAAASAPKALAEYAVHLVSTADEPDTVVEELLRMLAGCKELSTGTRDTLALAVQRLTAPAKVAA